MAAKLKLTFKNCYQKKDLIKLPEDFFAYCSLQTEIHLQNTTDEGTRSREIELNTKMEQEQQPKMGLFSLRSIW